MDEQQPTLSSDRELYVVGGGDWRFPIFADPYTMGAVELMLVQPAVGAEKEQLKALIEYLEPHSAGLATDGTNRMWIEKSVLLTVANKAPGITPEYYLHFPSMENEHAKLSELKPDRKSLPDSQLTFVDFLVLKCRLLDRVQATLFMQAIRQFGKEWLAYNQREIDFGIFTVIPLPFRSNWKETLYSIEQAKANKTYLCKDPVPKRWITMMRKRRDERNEWFAQEREDALYNTKLMDMHRTQGSVRWHLNIIEGKDYRDYVAQCEVSERGRRGPLKYTNALVRKIQERRGSILDLLSDWLAQIAHPCGAVEQQRNGSGQIIVTFKQPARSGRASYRKVPILPVVVDDHPEITGPTPLQRQVAGQTPNSLRQVLHLQPDEGDVRYGGSTMEQSKNGAA